MKPAKIAFIGAGSTIFMKNIVGDALRKPELADAHVALMDIDAARLAESALVARKLIATLGVPATVSTHADQAAAVEGADFVVCAFQIGGWKPCTETDFEIPRRFGLRQTIGDTLGVAGIMRGLRTIPHLWRLCADMARLCPDALLLQYVNPMAINTWAIAERFPRIRQVGLCHSIQNTVEELARELEIDQSRLRYRVGGVNHMAFLLAFEEMTPDGPRDLYPALRQGYAAGRMPRFTCANDRCANIVRFEVMKHFGYFATESSEHFAEYVPWFIKSHRPDLIERFQIPLDEYPRRCAEQAEGWAAEAEALKSAARIETAESHEYAAAIMAAERGGPPAVIYGNVPNHGLIPQLPQGCAVEVPCLVDRNGVQPTPVRDIPPQLTALMRSNVTVQELTVRAALDEDAGLVKHAAMLDPHTAAELDLQQISDLVDALTDAHGDWLPAWMRPRAAAA